MATLGYMHDRFTYGNRYVKRADAPWMATKSQQMEAPQIEIRLQRFKDRVQQHADQWMSLLQDYAKKWDAICQKAKDPTYPVVSDKNTYYIGVVPLETQVLNLQTEMGSKIQALKTELHNLQVECTQLVNQYKSNPCVSKQIQMLQKDLKLVAAYQIDLDDNPSLPSKHSAVPGTQVREIVKETSFGEAMGTAIKNIYNEAKANIEKFKQHEQEVHSYTEVDPNEQNPMSLTQLNASHPSSTEICPFLVGFGTLLPFCFGIGVRIYLAHKGHRLKKGLSKSV